MDMTWYKYKDSVVSAIVLGTSGDIKAAAYSDSRIPWQRRRHVLPRSGLQRLAGML